MARTLARTDAYNMSWDKKLGHTLAQRFKQVPRILARTDVLDIS